MPLPLLIPAQEIAYGVLKTALDAGNLVLLSNHPGRGRTTVLHRLHAETGGAFISAKDFIEGSALRHPLALEETIHACAAAALEEHDIVYVDDIDLIHNATSSCHFYPRGQYIETAVSDLCDLAVSRNKKLILSSTGSAARTFTARSFNASIPRYGIQDYKSLIGIFIGTEHAAAIDVEKVFRFAPKLTAHQIRSACDWLRPQGVYGTDGFIGYLRSQRLASNVDLSEVQAVDLSELQGVDDVLRSLDIHIVLPLENDAIANELGLRSKRGVLLYGPPGTGKTTVGRALAHRLRGKFFLVDGTFIAGTGEFYNRIQQLFEAAKENSPSVIFIDDADAIFEDGEERGLYRYLLTMLDGIESEGTARVCVMMTAMNLNHLPPALVRSGRVELWLEMKLPDADARGKILDRQTRTLPPDMSAYDREKVVAVTDGFTGADIKRVVEDAKGLYAFDRVNKQAVRPATDYLAEAAGAVQENKARYLQAEEASRAKPKNPLAAFFGGHFMPPPEES